MKISENYFLHIFHVEAFYCSKLTYLMYCRPPRTEFICIALKCPILYLFQDPLMYSVPGYLNIIIFCCGTFIPGFWIWIPCLGQPSAAFCCSDSNNYIKRIMFIKKKLQLEKIIQPSFSMSISKTFLFLPFFKRLLLKIHFRILKWVFLILKWVFLILKWVFLILKWNLGLRYFKMELVYFRIPEMESLFPSQIAAYVKFNKFGGVRFRIQNGTLVYHYTILYTYPNTRTHDKKFENQIFLTDLVIYILTTI